MKRLILIDAHAVIHRAYHALPFLTSPGGEPVNAVYGFTAIFLRILRELKPDYIAAAFDLPGPTFRHAAYERYKAQRPETPSDLSPQFAKVKEMLAAFDVAVFEKEGYEADDIIGTVAKSLAKNKNLETLVVTGDMDTLQLVSPRLKVCAMKKGVTETVTYDQNLVKERYGLKPKQMIDFKGLRGDPSDNIPGVKGIGEKTARELLENFGSMEGIYRALKKKSAKISPSVAAKLREGAEAAKFSKKLATINDHIPLKFRLADLSVSPGSTKKESLREVLRNFGFTSLLRRLSMGETAPDGKKPKPAAQALKITLAPAVLKTREEFQKIFSRRGSGEFAVIFDSAGVFLVPKNSARPYGLAAKLWQEKEVKEFLEKSDGFNVYDGKSLTRFWRGLDFKPPAAGFDLMIAAYLAGESERDFSYLAIVRRELGRMEETDSISEFSHFFEIKKRLEEKLKEKNLARVFSEIEMPLIPVLAKMEERGIKLDRGLLKKLAEDFAAKLQKLSREIYELVGESFNPNSPAQLSRVLFDKLKIGTGGLRKTKIGGAISTRESELLKLKDAHPAIQKVLDYRELAKLKSTYIDALPALADKSSRLHTTFNQTGTSTGRLSSSNPNLQNIPVMSGAGREIRRAFVADDGFVFASFDYSQIELRIAAHISGDEKMIEAFKKGTDIHRLTASEVYNIPLEKVTPDLRRAAKTLNFGVLYGMGPQTFAESTGMSREDAKKFIDEYFRDFAGVREYILQTKKFAQERGFVETIFGRRRYLPGIFSPNWQLKREAERMAVNMPIQGTAADLVKMAMIKIDSWIKKNGLGGGARLILQVHDELLFEIKEGLAEKIAPQIKKIMESVAKLRAPLEVDVKMGHNWGEME